MADGKPEYRRLWARYLCRCILKIQKRGFRVRRISLQNEPKAVQPWDSCVFTAREQRDFLVEGMHPAMVEHRLEGIEGFLRDHSRERVYGRMGDALAPESDPLVATAATTLRHRTWSGIGSRTGA